MRSVFLGLALAALGVALSCAKVRADTFTVTLPAHNAIESCTDDSTGAALTDLKWLRLYVRRYGSAGSPDTTLADSLDVAGREGQEFSFSWAMPESVWLAILIPRAVDYSGNESCIFGQRMAIAEIEGP